MNSWLDREKKRVHHATPRHGMNDLNAQATPVWGWQMVLWGKGKGKGVGVEGEWGKGWNGGMETRIGRQRVGAKGGGGEGKGQGRAQGQMPVSFFSHRLS